MYKHSAAEIVSEFPFRISFVDEQAVDTGGVCRDMFSAFWEEAYVRLFDGEALLVPVLHPKADVADFSVLGIIISQGFMTTGFLPVRISFPCLAAVLCGTEIAIPDKILLESFMDFLALHESKKIKEAVLQTSSFSNQMKSDLINILGRYGCTDTPTAVNIQQLVINIAQHQLISKSLGVLMLMRAAVPTIYHAFFKKFTVEQLFDLYKLLCASPDTVLENLEEPEISNSSEDKVYRYLVTFIGNSKPELLRSFLRFVTGSSVLLSNKIKVTFNSLDGVARRPISHTCSGTLELPLSYFSYPDFEQEFSHVLTDEMTWLMDAL